MSLQEEFYHLGCILGPPNFCKLPYNHIMCELEEITAQILGTTGLQVKNLGERNLTELKAQLAQLADTVTEISKVAQLAKPFCSSPSGHK